MPTSISEREIARRDAQRAASVAQRAASTIAEFAERNRLCRETVYSLIRLKRLKAHKVGSKTLIFAEDEAAWRNSLPVLELGSATA
jgi:excisionase family DNA binding protein